MKNILLVGKMCSGKTATAKFLEKEYDFTILSFASKLKWMIEEIEKGNSAIVIDYMLPDEKKEMQRVIGEMINEVEWEKGKLRKWYQFLGKAVRDRIDKNFWICEVSKEIKRGSWYIIDDCRFLNEFNYFNDLGFTSLKLDIPEECQRRMIEILYPNQDLSVLNHQSETEQNEIITDFTIGYYTKLIDKLEHIERLGKLTGFLTES